MEEKGFITGETREQDRLPARRIYHLTASGKKRFNIWLATPSRSSVRAIRVEFTSRLYFARENDPEFAHELIDAQIAETRAGLDRLKAMLEGIPEEQAFNRLGLDLRLRQLGSILAWLKDCYKVVRKSEFGGGS